MLAYFYATVLLLLIRSFTEAGNGAGVFYPVLDLTSRVIGILCIGVAILAKLTLPSSRADKRLTLASFSLLTIATLNGLLNFPFDETLASEITRILAIYAVYCLGSHFNQISIRSISLSLKVLAFTPAVVVIVTYSGGNSIYRVEGRASGTFSHPNSAAAFLGISALMLLTYFVKKGELSSFMLLVLVMFAMSMTQSLTTLLGVLLAMMVYLFLGTNLSISRRLTFVGFALGGGIVLSIGYINKLKEIFEVDLTTILSSGSNDTSIGWRILNWNLYLKTWEKSPFFGYGPGSASTHFSPLGTRPHSAFVQILIEYGLVGLIWILVVYFLLIKKINSFSQLDKATLNFAVPLGLYLLVLSLTSNILTYTSSMLFASFLFGIMSPKHEFENSKLAARKFEQRFSGRYTPKPFL